MSDPLPGTVGTPESRWRGHLDLVRRDRIAGWALDESHPDRPVVLRILDNGMSIGEVLAEDYREDLKAAGLAEGRYAFSFIVPGGLAPERRHLIEVRRADDGRALRGSPFILDATNPPALIRTTEPASWRGFLDSVSRERIEGWAFDARTPKIPLALVILDNGEVIARVLANRKREDLATAGMGDGRHGFSLIIPGGLSPLTRHVIQVLGEADGCEMHESPVVIEAAAGFDGALEHAVSAAVSAATGPAQRERVLGFLAAQTERVLQQVADADSSREARLIRRRLEHRWGSAADAPDTAGAAPLRRALLVDERLPAANRDAGSLALLSHMRALQALGYEVSFVAAEELSPHAEASAALECQGIHCCQLPYYASVEEVLRRQRDCFEVIYLHRASNAAKYLALARQYGGRARILYSVADLHHLRLARQAKVEKRAELLAQSRRVRLAECTAALMADAVITHSTVEADWLRRSLRGCNVHIVPWEVPVRPTAKPWSERRGVAFIGNFSRTPNVDAARVLTEQVMPRVWQQDASIECLLVGSDMSEQITRLSKPGIVAVGQVQDLADIFDRVRLTVAPLRYGAGVKGKVLESLAAGVPCVMSPIAAEGIALPVVLRGAIGADVNLLAAHILRLHSDQAAADAAAHAGLDFIREGYTKERVVVGLKSAIEGRIAPGKPEVAVGRITAS
jgi:glycosyltransferase involved in cell wall biosynthesis